MKRTINWSLTLPHALWLFPLQILIEAKFQKEKKRKTQFQNSNLSSNFSSKSRIKMELSCLRCSGSRGYVKKGNYPAVAVAVLGYRSPETMAGKWRALWRKVKKRVLLRCGWSGPREGHVPYNPQTYLQNFDEGCIMMVGDEDLDAISRSFSTRFAISSTILRRTKLVVHAKRA